MQKVIEFRGPQSEVVPEPLVAPPAMEPILAVVDSLSRTLNCIKTMCATEPNGPIRDRLETERANLVIGLFVARVARDAAGFRRAGRGCFSQGTCADRPPRLTRCDDAANGCDFTPG